jgi:hypothetical protein
MVLKDYQTTLRTDKNKWASQRKVWREYSEAVIQRTDNTMFIRERAKRQTVIPKTLQKSKGWTTQTSLNWGKLWCRWKISSSYSCYSCQKFCHKSWKRKWGLDCDYYDKQSISMVQKIMKLVFANIIIISSNVICSCHDNQSLTQNNIVPTK